MTMKKVLIIMVAVFAMAVTATAGEKDGRLGLGVGLLYENGLDATLSYERENAYHNAWEFFANGYLKWSECESDGHICSKSFWHGQRSWSIGAAYKPCVWRGKNNYGGLRFGGSLGSDLHRIIGGVHAGYEHNYRLKGGWQLYWQAKCDFMIKKGEKWRTGIAIGFKIPVK